MCMQGNILISIPCTTYRDTNRLKNHMFQTLHVGFMDDGDFVFFHGTTHHSILKVIDETQALLTLLLRQSVMQEFANLQQKLIALTDLGLLSFPTRIFLTSVAVMGLPHIPMHKMACRRKTNTSSSFLESLAMATQNGWPMGLCAPFMVLSRCSNSAIPFGTPPTYLVIY